MIDRGQDVNAELLMSLKQSRLAELCKPAKGQTFWIIVEYIFTFTITIIGLIIGWHLWKMKKALPGGEKIYVYSKNDRIHGQLIFLTGINLWPIAIFIKYFDKLNL